ncbi:MAG: ribbon-helix-helix domain-containing protein [Chlorobi bacterium]|nr:ribbon-helix-helix domain-containing protein [Chlorobiota bacterium]
MRNQNTYTSTLPRELFSKLNEYSQKLSLPKNRIIENALQSYFDKIKQAEYIQSFKNANLDIEMKSMAEEGLQDYLDIIDNQ